MSEHRDILSHYFIPVLADLVLDYLPLKEIFINSWEFETNEHLRQARVDPKNGKFIIFKGRKFQIQNLAKMDDWKMSLKQFRSRLSSGEDVDSKGNFYFNDPNGIRVINKLGKEIKTLYLDGKYSRTPVGALPDIISNIAILKDKTFEVILFIDNKYHLNILSLEGEFLSQIQVYESRIVIVGLIQITSDSHGHIYVLCNNTVSVYGLTDLDLLNNYIQIELIRKWNLKNGSNGTRVMTVTHRTSELVYVLNALYTIDIYNLDGNFIRNFIPANDKGEFLKRPRNLAFDHKNDHLYISDHYDQNVFIFKLDYE